jgi:hypothetical protein
MLDFQHPYNRAKIIKDMQQHYSSRVTNHEQILDQYFEAVSRGMIEGIIQARHDQLLFNTCPIRWSRLRRAIPRYNRQYYWLDWLHANYPLVKIIAKGSNLTENTMVTPLHNPDWKEDMQNALSPFELFDFYFGDMNLDQLLDPQQVAWVEIDLRSLESFILANEATVARTNQHRRNHAQATRIVKILSVIEQLQQNHPEIPFALPQVIKESEFGRQFLQGINLQTASKEVRHACLGRCYEYDIDASVFSWKLDLAHKIDDSRKFPATLDYLDYKDSIRRRLANEIFENLGSEAWRTGIIKRAITAISFGARATNAIWMGKNGEWQKTSLRDIIVDGSRLQRFLQDRWVREFVQEQTAMTDLIFAQVRTEPEIAERSILKTERGALSKNKTISWLYQHSERCIIEKLMKIAEPSEILLLCHDAFYTRKSARLIDLRECMREENIYSTIKEQHHRGWSFHDDQAHHDHIIQEEELAHKINGKLFNRRQIELRYFHVQKFLQHSRNHTVEQEYDNGNRLNSNYDLELDPFYMEEE